MFQIKKKIFKDENSKSYLEKISLFWHIILNIDKKKKFCDSIISQHFQK